MDKESEKQKKANQTSKAKKKPLKVVYISNPVKVKANTSEFRALVQELTGRNADPSRYAGTEDTSDFTALLEHTACTSLVSPSNTAPTGSIMEGMSSKSNEGTFDNTDEEVSTPQMIDNYSVFSPSTMLGELHDYQHGKI